MTTGNMHHALKGGPIVSPVTNVWTSIVSPIAGTYFSTMVDCQLAKNLVFKVTNTCDQPITVQVIGNLIDATADAVLMDGVMAVVALTGVITVDIDLSGDDWHQYIGLTIIVPAGVTLGQVIIDEVTRS